MSRKSSAEQPRRVKVTLACIICRKKKVKCDGIQPTCTRCHSMGIQCQYSDPPKKRGPPKGYVEVINNRAHRIESLLGKQKPTHNSPLSSATVWSPSITTNNPHDLNTENLVSPASPTTLTPVTLLPQQQNEVLKLVTEATGAVKAKLSNNPGSHQNMLISSPNDNSNNSNDDNEEEENELISSKLALLWTNHVFQHFNIFFPILSRQHFLFQLMHQRRSMNPLLRYAVYALGCRYDNPEGRNAQRWFDKAFTLVDHEINVSLSTVQALAIMCWYTYLSGDLQQCHYLRRQLYRAVYDCNLGQEATSYSVVEQEMRRRGLWASYVIDQWLAVCTGEKVQPALMTFNVKLPKLEDNQLYAIDIRNLQPLPVDQQELSVESALQVAVFSEMVKLVKVMVCSSDGRNAKAALTEWLLHLPPYLEFGKATDDSPPSPIARIFHLLYYTVQVMISRPVGTPTSMTTTHPFHQQQTNHTAVDHDSTTAANTIVHIAEQMVQSNQIKYLYNVFGLSLTLATMIHLENTCLFGSASANNSLTRSLNVLQITNCTIVSRADLDRILHRFVANRCGIVHDHYQQQQQQHQQEQTRAVTHRLNRNAELKPTSLKRPHLGDELERAIKRPSFDFSRWLPPEEQQYTAPSSFHGTENYNSIVDLFTRTTEPTVVASSNNDDTTTAAPIDMLTTATAAAAVANFQMEFWNHEQNLFSTTTSASTSTSTSLFQISPSSSTSSPMVTPKPGTNNPSPALTMITTPIDTSTSSYFSPHVNNTHSSPTLLSNNHGFDISKENDIHNFVPDSSYSIDFQNTII